MAEEKSAKNVMELTAMCLP